MAEKQAEATKRPDVDILEDVHKMFGRANYPPLAHDRSRMEITVHDGLLTASGHVRTPQVREVFVKNATLIPGVKKVDVSELFDDEMIRFDVGRVTPNGVYAMVQYGAVVLHGDLPEGTTEDEIVAQAAQVGGVRKVLTNFEA